VIIDLEMPGLRGGATAARLRSINPEVKILIHTGVESSPAGQSLLPDGCLALLKKPADIDVLLQTVDQALGADRPGVEPS